MKINYNDSKRKGFIMTTLSNSNLQRTITNELNSIIIEFFQNVKKFAYKHHKVLGYF